MKNNAYRFSALSGTFYGLLYIGLMAASIVCFLRSPNRNQILKKKNIWPVCIMAIVVCMFEIIAIVSQQMVFTGDSRHTPTHRWWGAIRTLTFQYLSPWMVLTMTYITLMYFMDCVFQVGDESGTKAGIPDWIANASYQKKQLVLAGTMIFGITSTMVSALPGSFISWMSFLDSKNHGLYNSYHGISNFWESVIFVNAVVIGLILAGGSFLVYNSSEKYSRTIGRFLNFALMLAIFEVWVWSRFAAVLIDKVGFNQMNATDIQTRGPVFMFCMYLTITVTFLSATLLSNSALVSNRLKDYADRKIEDKGSASAYGYGASATA
jgi:hypothetical protein